MNKLGTFRPNPLVGPRREKIIFYVTKAEKREIMRRAKALKLNKGRQLTGMSTYIRWCALYHDEIHEKALQTSASQKA